MATPSWDDTISPSTTPSAIPSWDNTEDVEEKYGSAGQQILAGVESAASAGTLGLSRHLENMSGLTTPQAQALREQVNPVTSTVGGLIGTGALIAGTGGAGALTEGAALGTKLGAMALEGGVLGAGNAVSDAAMGDPNLNAQKILTHIGFGAALGAGGGLLFESLLPSAGRQIGAVKDALRKVYGAGAEEASEELGSAGAEEAQNIIDAPTEAKKGIQSTSIEDIQKKVNDAKFSGNAIEMPQKTALEDAASRVELEHAVHPMQVESLNSQRARDAYQTAKEMGDEGQLLQQYEALQKGELVAKTDNAIQDTAGQVKVTPDAVHGGEIANDYFTKNYQGKKGALAPQFESFKEAKVDPSINHLPDVIEKMSEAVPNINKMLNFEGDTIAVRPYKEVGGSIPRQTYDSISDVIDAFNSPNKPESVRDLLDIRKTLDQHVNILEQGEAPSQVRGLKKSLMDYTQDIAGNDQIRGLLKDYAVNEQDRGIIERIFKGSVGSQELGGISKGNVASIGDKIFSRPETVEAAKRILGKENFDHVLGNWLAEARAAATDKNAFSSNKFGSFLKRNQDALNAAFSDRPEQLQRLKDLTTIMRILPDAPSINPSGTAKTLINYLKDSHSLTDAGINALKFIKDKTMGKVEKQINLQNLNNQLAGKEANYTLKEAVTNAIKKTTDKIDSSAGSIFKGNTKDVIRGGAASSIDHYNNHVDSIQKLSNDDSAMLNHMNNSTQALYSSMPNISQGISGTINKGVLFLNSKLPKPNSEMLLSEKWEPNDSQKQKFNRYFNAVNDPVGSLKAIKNGTLSNETMEALQAVHPELLQEMREKVTENIDHKKAKNLSYSTKIALSKFMGQPLMNSMVPAVIIADQAAYAMPQQQPQGSVKKQRSSVSGLSKLGASKRSATMSQDLEDDKV